MAAVQAVIFDIDDTLYPEITYTRSGYRAVADAFAARLAAPFDLYARLCALFDTPERARVFDVVVEQAGTTDAGLVDEMVACFRGHSPDIVLFPDADGVLHMFAGRYRLGAISDGYLAVQRAKAQALGLFDRLDEVILTDTWGREFWKPHPRAFEEIAARWGIPHAACVYVGDNRAKDFVAPNALGWRTVCVDRPTGVHRENAPPTGGAPQAVIATLAQLPALLDRISP